MRAQPYPMEDGAAVGYDMRPNSAAQGENDDFKKPIKEPAAASPESSWPRRSLAALLTFNVIILFYAFTCPARHAPPVRTDVDLTSDEETCLRDPSRKMAFVHISRTGGTELETLLQSDLLSQQLLSPYDHKQTAKQYMEGAGVEAWSQAFRFTLVRNEYERLLSQFLRQLTLCPADVVQAALDDPTSNDVDCCKFFVAQNFLWGPDGPTDAAALGALFRGWLVASIEAMNAHEDYMCGAPAAPPRVECVEPHPGWKFVCSSLCTLEGAQEGCSHLPAAAAPELMWLVPNPELWRPMNDPAKAAAQQQPMVEMIRTEERESVLWPRIQALACDERVKSMTFAEATAYAIEHAPKDPNCQDGDCSSINIVHGTPGSHEHYSKYYDNATLQLLEPWVRPDLIATGYHFEFEPDPKA